MKGSTGFADASSAANYSPLNAAERETLTGTVHTRDKEQLSHDIKSLRMTKQTTQIMVRAGSGADVIESRTTQAVDPGTAGTPRQHEPRVVSRPVYLAIEASGMKGAETPDPNVLLQKTLVRLRAVFEGEEGKVIKRTGRVKMC